MTYSLPLELKGVELAQWLRCPIHDREVMGSTPAGGQTPETVSLCMRRGMAAYYLTPPRPRVTRDIPSTLPCLAFSTSGTEVNID